jgi:polar amino acid transport system substrate-binding protein
MRRLAGLAILAGALALATPAPAQEGRVIRVAIEGAYPPFNFIEDNEFQGFEPDLLKALCAVMKARCLPVQRPWDGIVRGLVNGEYDAVMSSLEITDKRRNRIAFSRRYYLIPAAFIALKTSDIRAITPVALAGRRIGATDRSEHAALIENLYRDAQLSVYGKLEEADLDLAIGRLDLVLGDKLALSRFLASREGACCRFVGDVPENPIYHGHGYGIGLRKEDTALKAEFDAALLAVIGDGTYDRIRTRYIPFDIK